MFARLSGRVAAPVRFAGVPCLNGSQEVQTRNAATLKSLTIRLRSIKNMQKITKAMKMVATSKFKKDMFRMEQGLVFTQPVINLLERLPREEHPGQISYVAITSDKGLCGGVNSAVSKYVRLGIQEEEAKGNSAKIMILGGKGVAAMKRQYGDRFSLSFEDISKATWNFGTCCMIADRILAQNPQRLSIVSNTFKSMVAYDTSVKQVITKDTAKTMDKTEWSKAMDTYSFEPSIFEVWEDLQEFYTACAIYGQYLNSCTTETAQRMSAMENASKNAGEMFEKVTLQFNRARQAKITTELCEIISGAAAV